MTKKLFFISITIFSLIYESYAQTDGVLIDYAGGVKDDKAVFQLNATDKGFLVPRVSLLSNGNPVTGVKPTGLMVYNLGGGFGPDGFYYWNGSTWIMVATGTGSTGYIQNQNASAQAANYWISGTANSQAGYISTSNPWGTANSAFFPNGITTAGATNWIYGSTNYIGNAPSNGYGHQFNAASGNSSAWLAIGGGNVGIATTAPNFKLDIQQDMTIDGDITPGKAQFSISGATTPGKRMILGYDTNGNGFGYIKAGNYGVSWTPLALQPNGGNVGIGTTAPAFRLHVPSGYIGTDYINTTDNSVGSGVTGVMIKAGDNYLRTGTAAAVAAFLGTSLAGNYIQNQNASAQAANYWINGTAGIGITSAPQGQVHSKGADRVMTTSQNAANTPPGPGGGTFMGGGDGCPWCGQWWTSYSTVAGAGVGDGGTNTGGRAGGLFYGGVGEWVGGGGGRSVCSRW